MSRTDTATRIISAPPDRVFAALTDPDALAVWLPPDGITGRFEHFDARPCGPYRLVLTYADAAAARGKSAADSDVVDGRFVKSPRVYGSYSGSSSCPRTPPLTAR